MRKTIEEVLEDVKKLGTTDEFYEFENLIIECFGDYEFNGENIVMTWQAGYCIFANINVDAENMQPTIKATVEKFINPDTSFTKYAITEAEIIDAF